MRVWRALEEVPGDLAPSVVTIGNFDGVHLGHRVVVRRAREVASRCGVERVTVVTFDPHPIAVLRPDHAPPTLSAIPDRLELLADAGVDDALVLPFDRELASWSPQRFVERILVESLHARAVVVGANFRFGNRAAGDVAFLREAGADHGFDVEGVELDGGPQVWSSTYVRQCVAAGDVAGAAEALGRPFAVRGTVVSGDRRGRELGYPTANVPIGTGAAPPDGVYAGRLRVLDDGPDAGVPHPAAISVGSNPTFAGERERRVEAYVLDRDDLELYGREVEVSFTAHVRGMTRFDGIDELLEAMASDVAATRRALGT
ncbi:bifunctional riboflavin kinase/FAD synthetase [Nocardioides lentus]|uniref:Riboflavin biosynthesis protein n=1 Tax=Nocardioides lentus TaxID=338077 RepID=A0ABP5AL93_9ACTN